MIGRYFIGRDKMMHEPQKISLISKKTRKAGKACVSWKVVKRATLVMRSFNPIEMRLKLHQRIVDGYAKLQVCLCLNIASQKI
jgi:hypothetical protein